jgi:hypothetical protein
MRKVLLATTALVAMSITGAHADITISGNLETNYNNDGTSSSMGQDGNITLKASSTSDSGLSALVVANMGIQGRAMDMEDSYMELSGDFGAIRMGNTDMAGDVKDGVLGRNSDVYSFGVNSVFPSGATDYTDTQIMDNDSDTSISYYSPSISGLQVYGGAVIDKEQVMGINYSFSGFNLMYQNGSKAGLDENVIGVGFSMAGVSINMGKKREKTVSTVTNSSDLNLKYSVSDALTVSYLIQKGKQGATKHSKTGLEAEYIIAPGVAAYVGLNNADNGTKSDDSTGAAIVVSF